MCKLSAKSRAKSRQCKCTFSKLDKIYTAQGTKASTDSHCREHSLRLSTVDLLIKVVCFVLKVNNIFDIK